LELNDNIRQEIIATPLKTEDNLTVFINSFVKNRFDNEEDYYDVTFMPTLKFLVGKYNSYAAFHNLRYYILRHSSMGSMDADLETMYNSKTEKVLVKLLLESRDFKERTYIYDNLGAG